MFGRAGRPRFARAPSVLILSATVWLTAAVTALASPALASPVPSSPGHPSPLAASATAPEVAKFPPDFLWGVSSSGFQSEGSFPDSNWTRYVDKKANGVKDPYNNSVDFRHRYPGDVRLAQGLGVNVFRTSIEWARVEPRRGVRSAAALAYYDDLVRRIRAAGMRPMITLDHWVYPGWVADQGAWDNARTQDDWLRNAQFLVDRYKGQGVLWITFNEISQNLYHELLSRPMNLMQLATMRTALIRTHRAAYDLIHRVDPGAPVSTNVAYGSVFNAVFDAAAFNEVTDKLDFVGIDYYYGANLQNFSAINAMTGEYWKIDPEPEGLYYVLKNYQRRLPNLPLYIVESGTPTDDGKPRADGYTRADHMRDHLYWVQRAIADGVKVIGYNQWSLTDNYEWGSYRPRFGLYTVDVLTDPELKRRPTDGVPVYRSIIANRGVPGGYVPKRKPGWCSIEDPIATCFGTPATPPAPYQKVAP
ncbi:MULTISPECIES: glycoside hydrolase family 1 protein [Thermomonosporaceae]|uniref:glycoside hydrolase family 1 protein n=1 Tax=Thermomonosporaceae TaxID=2012 RepID=UPI00255ACDC7|nr:MULTISPECIES: family 1 glycosylhydrolase [Thermomonosporaceae]MDL4772925.1 family 1 glycosylhydrolase [Actinomadura xylanilytica]